MSQMTLTIDTKDTKVVREAAEMLLRLSGSVPLEFMPQVSVVPTFCQEANAVAEQVYEQATEQVREMYKDMVAVNDNNVATMTLDEQLEMDVTCGYVDPSQAFAMASSDVPPPPPPPAVNVSDYVELDSAGIPWDARIHTGARTKVADGTWKIARNTPKELIASVKAEYLGNVAPVQSPTTNNVNTVEPKVARIGDVPPPPPPPPAEVGTQVDPIRVFMSDLAKAALLPAKINEALQRHGVATLQVIRNFPEKIPAIRLELGL